LAAGTGWMMAFAIIGLTLIIHLSLAGSFPLSNDESYYWDWGQKLQLSYYDHPLVRELYAGWTFRELEATKALVNQGMRDKGGAVKAPELLIINGPSLVEHVGLFTEKGKP
jgi:hypothetical protein